MVHRRNVCWGQRKPQADAAGRPGPPEGGLHVLPPTASAFISGKPRVSVLGGVSVVLPTIKSCGIVGGMEVRTAEDLVQPEKDVATNRHW